MTQKECSALRACFFKRNVPRDEITFGPVVTTIENASALRLTFDEMTAAFMARHAHIFDDRFRIAARREVWTSQELAESALLDDHEFTALLSDGGKKVRKDTMLQGRSIAHIM